MLEYDQNLPQELDEKPKRMSVGVMITILALAGAILVYALIVLLPFISRHQV
jgi:hypothetical protein